MIKIISEGAQEGTNILADHYNQVLEANGRSQPQQRQIYNLIQKL